VNATNSSGTAPLLAAAAQWQGNLTENQETILWSLLEKGAEVDKCADSSVRTALHQAITGGVTAAVQLLLKYGASTETTTSRQNALGLSCAQVLKMDTDIHGLIMGSIVSNFDHSSFTQEGGCMLGRALTCESSASLEMLLDHGMSARQVYLGRPLLHHATAEKRLDVAQLLVKRGAWLEDQNEDNEDSLVYAREQKASEIREWLVQFQRRKGNGPRSSNPVVPGAYVE
jgi:ankyrin repeat protein